jgi:hypothetical protein
MCGPSCGTGSTGKSPKLMKWYVGSEDRDITVFTDYQLQQVTNYNCKFKVALIFEPEDIIPQIYQWIKINYHLFDYILTYDDTLIQISNKFVYCPNTAGHWISDDDIKIYNKNKLVSIFASNKNFMVGHQMRHLIIENYKSHIDGIFGRGSYGYLDNKIDGLKDYAFHIVVENVSRNFFFSEKIIDALIVGAVPIYYGCPSIHNFFRKDGILQFNNIKEFEDILKNHMNMDYYNTLLRNGIIQENWNLAMNYLYPEDNMYKLLFSKLV